MEIKLKRETFTDVSTISKLSVDGTPFGYVLEDIDRGLTQDMPLDKIKAIKVHGKTAIPKGTYQVVLSYSNRFQQFLPELIHVPGYAGIRIHPGNKAEDTEGCLLPGETCAKDMVLNSRRAFAKLFALIKQRIKTEKVFVVIE